MEVSLDGPGFVADAWALLSDCFELQPATAAATNKRIAMCFTVSPLIDWSYKLSMVAADIRRGMPRLQFFPVTGLIYKSAWSWSMDCTKLLRSVGDLESQ
ncbi:hypothetical protein [Burkholderia contaminans]|uniref:hypothetical protein n=1 Tax=Burkholderia contaminans TaxID=488447 RepID=UPI0015838C7F|nr:hypothetical protein [Burkholderia contaminans]